MAALVCILPKGLHTNCGKSQGDHPSYETAPVGALLHPHSVPQTLPAPARHPAEVFGIFLPVNGQHRILRFPGSFIISHPLFGAYSE